MRPRTSSLAAVWVVAASVGAVLAAPAAATPRTAAARVDLVRVEGARLGQEILEPSDRPRLVHLWASWCGPCRAELPLLSKALRAPRRRGLDVVILALDEPSAEDELRRLLVRSGAFPGKLRVALPADALPVILRVDPLWDGSVPSSYLLDGHGAVLFAQRGLTIVPELTHEIDRALGAE